MNIQKIYKCSDFLITEEINPSALKPVSSFKLHKELSKKVWDGWKLKPEIREDLIKISNDYIDFLDTELKIKDVLFLGSLSGYNYSKYSDFDVHILVDFEKIPEDEKIIIKKYLDVARKLWGEQHNIQIEGYDVELYCQDIDEENSSTSIYSLKSGEWIKKPVKSNFVPDEDLIKNKSENIMSIIDDIEMNYKNGVPYKNLKEDIEKIWDKIKKMRKSGLEKEGEFSVENLVFKVLRRNSYLGRLIKMKRESYDAQFEKKKRKKK